MKIPTFEEAKQALIEKRGTPLDKFVAYWEPMSPEDEKFRDMFDDALHYVVETLRKERDGRKDLEIMENPLRFLWNPSTERYEEKK